MAKKHNSKRNRHTGHINAIKNKVLMDGVKVTLGDRDYMAIQMNPDKRNSITAVRIPEGQ